MKEWSGPIQVDEEMTKGDPACGLAEPFSVANENSRMVSLHYEVWRVDVPGPRRGGSDHTCSWTKLA